MEIDLTNLPDDAGALKALVQQLVGTVKTQGLKIVDIKVGDWPGKQFTLINGDHRQVITLFDTGEADRVRALLASDISNALIAERLAAYAAALK